MRMTKSKTLVRALRSISAGAITILTLASCATDDDGYYPDRHHYYGERERFMNQEKALVNAEQARENLRMLREIRRRRGEYY